MYNYMNKRTIIRGLQGDVAFDFSLDLWKDFSQLRGSGASLVAQEVKCLPAMRETRVRSQVGKIPWRKKWQPTPVLLPGKFHGWSSLVGYNPWDHKESDTTEQLQWFTGEEESSVLQNQRKGNTTVCLAEGQNVRQNYFFGRAMQHMGSQLPKQASNP